jgi:hypothetical protein
VLTSACCACRADLFETSPGDQDGHHGMVGSGIVEGVEEVPKSFERADVVQPTVVGEPTVIMRPMNRGRSKAKMLKVPPLVVSTRCFRKPAPSMAWQLFVVSLPNKFPQIVMYVRPGVMVHPDTPHAEVQVKASPWQSMHVCIPNVYVACVVSMSVSVSAYHAMSVVT